MCLRLLRGSSPLTRGARVAFLVKNLNRGLIPAHAGSTAALALEHCVIPAHPRSRGEHVIGGRVKGVECGSSPLTRGAPSDGVRHQQRTGLIPAHAGSTFSARRNTALSPAHPRSRGEHVTTPPVVGRTRGSSPLTRGALSFMDMGAKIGGGSSPLTRGAQLFH